MKARPFLWLLIGLTPGWVLLITVRMTTPIQWRDHVLLSALSASTAHISKVPR